MSMLISKTAVGAAFGTAKSGIGIAGLGTFKPELIMKVRRKLISHLRSIELSCPSSQIVSHSRGHVRYHCGIRPGGVRAYCWRS